MISPRGASPQLRQLAQYARSEATNAGLVTRSFASGPEVIVGEETHGKTPFLSPRDAFDLYETAHRNPVVVLALTEVLVRLDPRQQKVTRKKARRLDQFVWHKAFYALVNGRTDVGDAFARFGQWRASPRCLGEEDNRVLPLHVFSTGRAWPELGSTPSDEEFRKLYGLPGSRVDEGGRRWRRADRQAYHGTRVLVIAGCELLAGMHWDVTAGKKTMLMTSREVWHMPRRSQLNVYPNSKVRKTQSSAAKPA